ncbi:MAG TPA: diguanylate cyclase [Cyanobacteria bacterium UBA11049]|nr:diguanylate cyclase [Cyanobacteria bacterium UBA11049]
MTTTPQPFNEVERLEALRRYNILDTPPEETFDRITALAARLFNVPTALISLVDEFRAWFKSCYGFDSREIPRDATICSFAVLSDDVLVVLDTRQDSRFACSPFAANGAIRFYAGAALITHDGFNLGTLCLVDSKPRLEFSAEQQATLSDLAAMVVDELELRLAANKMKQMDTALLEITRGVSTATGEAFFFSLVRHLSKALDVQYAFIGELVGKEEEKIKILSIYAQGQIQENIEYSFVNTPCENVIRKGKSCSYPRNLQRQFPDDEWLAQMEVDSYVATPLLDSKGCVLGLLGVMDRKPLENVQLVESLLTIFATRAVTELERQRAEEERIQMSIRDRQYTNQLHGLTKAALVMNSDLSIEEVLQAIAEQARAIIGAHQSVTSLTINQNWAQAINAVSLSDKYAQWRDYDEPTDGSGIYACVCRMNKPMRMTQAELELHPRWRGFGKNAEKHPPMRGWLAAPLTGRDGRNIGLIQLSDKYSGEFTSEDEAIIVQLAQMASVAVENTQLYEAQQQARTQAETANRIKDEFLAVLSHELRSPLNPILGWSKLLLTRQFDSAKTNYALETIERNAKLQSELIEDLLDVSRILRGKLSLNVCPVELAPTIAAAIETVRLAAESKSIDLRFTILDFRLGNAGENPELIEFNKQANNSKSEIQNPKFQVMGDPARLQQVFWNLVSNAVKFTPCGGQVEIQLSEVTGNARQVKGNETIQSPTTNYQSPITSYAQIQVSDTGKGINPEFLPFVFDYFRQADSTTTRVFGGLGLGLAIVHHLVELHGGTVKAESPGVGQGATFTVKIPLLERTGGSKEVEEAGGEFDRESPNLAGVRVLVVDDDIDSRDLIAFILEEYGATVRAVASASEALNIFALQQPDILLSDIGMPEMDGYMLIRSIRSLPQEQGKEIPAIALTAYAGETDNRQILMAGFQKHITKPIEPLELATAIVQLLESNKGAKENNRV